MELGAFSVSLAVADLARSRAFYESLGFSVIGGSADDNYLILKNGASVIGLFQGMFDGNILTFNPGLDQDKNELAEFRDVREIQAALLAHGVEIDEPVDAETSGPGHIMVSDPDGNAILIDQFR